MTEPLDNVRRLREAAEEVPPADDGGNDDGRRHTGQARLPEGCPVTPLGINGDMYYLLDAAGQFREVKDERFTRLKIASLFGSYAELLEDDDYWPRKTKDGDTWVTTGWRPEAAAMALTSACADLGVWSPFEKLRGRGAWLGEDGELVLHCGDRVMIGPPPGPTAGNQRPRWHDPGKIGGYVYPTASPIMRPHPEPQPRGEVKGSPGAELKALLSTWNWKRGEVDVHLLMGLIGAQKIGGAIKVRPTGWMTGGKGTGKSTAQQVVKMLHGESGIISVSDASAAGVWQKLKYDSLPVGLDEIEAEEDNRKAQALVKLARQAATGGLVLRGGADHAGAEFVTRSCFLFSSILMPPMLPQDRSRMIILEVGRLKSIADIGMSSRRFSTLGARILRRLVDGWYRWQETFEVYREALSEFGHNGRGADVFGTALACADLILHDGVPDFDYAKSWAEKLAAPALSEIDGDVSDEQSCWQHLISTVVEPYRSGGRKTIGEWISRARGIGKGIDDGALTAGQIDEANQVLQTYGLRLVGNVELCKLFKARSIQELQARAGCSHLQPPYLAVANSHPAVAQIFAGTHWASRSGASGVWVQALRRLDGVVVPPSPLWLSGDGPEIRSASHRVTLVPLDGPRAQGDGTSPGAGALLD